MAEPAQSTRAILFALGANASIFVAKSLAAWFTGSGAMLAEAVHSLADCGNQLLLLLGKKRAERPATPDAPLGYGKAVYFWSFMVALMLFALGGLFSLYEGWHKLNHPEAVTRPWLAVGVLLFSMAAEGTALRTCLQIIGRTRGDRTLLEWFRTTRQAELVVVFGEDAAALIGLSLALAAVVLTMLTGNPLFDALGTLGIGALMIVVAWFVGMQIKSMLIGKSAAPRIEKQMREFLLGQAEVVHLYNLITLQLGPDIMVAVKARMRDAPDAAALIADINRTESALKARFPEVRWSFFEPDDAD